MTTDSDTTLIKIRRLKAERFRPTLRLLFDGKLGPLNVPGIPISTRPLMVGRSGEVQGIQLADPRASRQHVGLWVRPGASEVVFEDRSTNGTFVNGKRQTQGVLDDGDVLRVGDSFLLVRFLPEEVDDAPSVSSVVGDAPALRHLRRTIHMVAPTDATVLIVGESGTGKELVAQAIHERSQRAGPFVPVNCSAIPATLAESQLFGHTAGSFTGARDHHGYFRAAQKGTLFLDELGELPSEIQPKLLRVLEDRMVMPVGALNPIPMDVRILAATNRDLEGAVATERFRGDLFARLAEITIRTPTLRSRREDVLPLFQLGFGEELPPLSADLVEALLLHPWPFNVRELFKVAKELRIVGAGAGRLSLALIEHRFAKRPPGAWHQAPHIIDQPTRREEPGPRAITKTYEVDMSRQPIPTRQVVEDLLRTSGGNISELGRQLGRSRRQVYRYLKMYQLSIEDYRD